MDWKQMVSTVSGFVCACVFACNVLFCIKGCSDINHEYHLEKDVLEAKAYSEYLQAVKDGATTKATPEEPEF